MRINIRHLLFVFAVPLGCDSGAGAFQPDVPRLSRGAVAWTLTTAVNQGSVSLNADFRELFAPLSRHGSSAAHVVPVQPAVPLQFNDSAPFVHYTLTIIKETGETPLGEVLSVHTADHDFEAGKEYWALQQGGLNDIDDATAIEIEGTQGDWGNPPSWPPSGSLPVFWDDVQVSWSSGAPGSGDTVFKYAGSNYVAWVWGLTYSQQNGWGGQLAWYRTASAQPSSSSLLFGTGTYTLSTQTGGGSAPPLQYWWRYDANPKNGMAREDIEAGLSLMEYLADKPLAALSDAPAHLRKRLMNQGGQRFMKYLVGAALDSSEALAVSIGEGFADTIEWQGELGLCPQWASSAPPKACLRRVTAYLLASVNAQSLRVPISLREPGRGPVSKVPVQDRFREDRGTSIASFEPCTDPGAAAREGATRNCGWVPRYVGICRANREVTLGVHIDITEPGTIRGGFAVMVRVTDGIYGTDDLEGANPTPGGKRSYASINESMRIGTDGRITFVCPENGPSIDGVRYGYFGIMLAAPDPNWTVPARIDVEPVTEGAVYPAHEYQVFTRREGVFWGNLAGGVDQQHACYDQDWNEGIAQASGRFCLLPGTRCFTNPPRQCGSVDAKSVGGFAVYVNDPGDR